jgi:hypothetical protein
MTIQSENLNTVATRIFPSTSVQSNIYSCSSMFYRLTKKMQHTPTKCIHVENKENYSSRKVYCNNEAAYII